MHGMNVLSLFDGMSGGRLSLERAKIEVNNYYSSEIDKYAIAVADLNYPQDVKNRLGNVTEWKEWRLPKIDLLIAGSPCQGFSLAGKQLNFNDERSKLFFEFVDILKNYKPKYFMLENVKMKKQYQDIISDLLGVDPIEINSSLVSGQNRKRLYWTNIPGVEQPKDAKIYLKDIIEKGEVDRDKSYCLDANYFKGGNLKQYFEKKRRQLVFNGLIHVGEADLKGMDCIKRVYDILGKAPTLTAMCGGHREPKIALNEFKYRKLTPLECERLQTITDNFTEFGDFEGVIKKISNTQRYKMIGNGWTIDVIAHILKGLVENE